ncbi:UNVERIFIED_CONTAM: DNA mismatch repair protein MSH6 [Sesamum angustifolium]|uniref:DNA mismatch repair protein MSH6 n=1 Tax=Sesamum angustifolium TaxID=2727405 RepID=A0AAW2QV36_9LAMI
MWGLCYSAELDVLISLSIASEYYEGKTCRPVLSASHSDEVPFLTAKSLGHPVLRSDTLAEGTFVTNDFKLGGSGNASVIVLTGPNMGGKSTLLRQVCLAVILAQIGADVPAESFALSPIDRIFVRMGAKDHIMAGHSTFLTELLETASMLSSATRNSLVALDELGRGTSTSDGQAIAASVLEHFVRTVQCRGMFSTHYHRLAVDYQKDPRELRAYGGSNIPLQGDTWCNALKLQRSQEFEGSCVARSVRRPTYPVKGGKTRHSGHKGNLEGDCKAIALSPDH